MRTFSTMEITKVLQKENLALFSLDDFKKIFKIAKRNTLYKKIQRLEEKKIIKRLAKGKYLFLFQKPHDFLMANFLYQPSYISLESALSLYGIISGMSYQITSLTPKKTKTIVIDVKEYVYSQIKSSLFWGYEKKQEFLIADKEKAFLDYLYFAFKGLRQKDLSEFDLSSLDKKRIKNYFNKIKDKNFKKFYQQMVK